MSDFSSDMPLESGPTTRAGEESPITLARLVCPVCHTVNEFETVRPGAYVEEGTDTDFRPLARRWTNPRYQSVNPLLYFMATCSTCFYTREFNRAFREAALEIELTPEESRTVRLRHLALVADPNGVVKRLGGLLWPESFPLQTAISKLLLGILDEQLKEDPSDYDLARWYLRVAWLFRELRPVHGAEGGAALPAGRHELEKSLAGLGEELEQLRGRLQQAMRFLQMHAHAAQKSPDDSQGPAQCHQSLQQLIDQSETMAQLLVTTRQALAVPQATYVGAGRVSAVDESFGEHASFSEFLRTLKVDDESIPINEEEALAFSRTHYKRAFEAQGGIDRGHGAMMTAYLIGELSRRLSCFDEAERYLDMARVAASLAIKESGQDKPRSALARHLAHLAERQSQALYEASSKLG